MTEAEGFHEPDTPNPFLTREAESARKTAIIARLEAELAGLRTKIPGPGEVIVSRDDLRAVLADVEGVSGAIDRLCAAVGL